VSGGTETWGANEVSYGVPQRLQGKERGKKEHLNYSFGEGTRKATRREEKKGQGERGRNGNDYFQDCCKNRKNREREKKKCKPSVTKRRRVGGGKGGDSTGSQARGLQWGDRGLKVIQDARRKHFHVGGTRRRKEKSRKREEENLRGREKRETFSRPERKDGEGG